MADDQRVVGVGIVFDEEASSLIVESLVPQSGADACGDVFPGDELLTIDGKDVTGQRAAAIAKLIAGPVGTTVVVTLRRRLPESFESDRADSEDRRADEDESEVKVVEILRSEFSIDQQHFVPWTEVVDVAKAPVDKGWAHGAGRLFAGVTPMQNSLMKQMKSLQTSVQTSVQNNSLFENISSKAIMVRQSATSAVLPVLKNMQPSSAAVSDPRPKDYCMHLYTHPDRYVVMPPALPPLAPGAGARQALVIERASHQVHCVSVEQAEDMTRGNAKVSIMGVLGIARLQHASYLLVVTGRQVVGYMPHGLVYRVTHTGIRVLGPASKGAISQQGPLELSNRAIEYKLLEELLETYSMLYSHDFDITHTQQRLSQRGMPPASASHVGCASARVIDYNDREQRFVWNSHLLSTLVCVQGAWSTDCLLPVVSGFLAISTRPAGCTAASPACMALIARRDWHRCGYRYLSRGIDDDGNVSNAVETEQLLFLPNETLAESLPSSHSPSSSPAASSKPSGDPETATDAPNPHLPNDSPPAARLADSTDAAEPDSWRQGASAASGHEGPVASDAASARPAVTSFVTVRGSIPLVWSEAETFGLSLKPRPELELTQDNLHLKPMTHHLNALQQSYGKVAVLSLIEHKESSHERPMGLVFERVMQSFRDSLAESASPASPVRMISFDFHSVCGKLAFRNLPLLVNECKDALHEYDFFASGRDGPDGGRQQAGVFRVNCVDCLDRTNVAQSVLAFRIALHQLRELSVCSDEELTACLASLDAEETLPFRWAQEFYKEFKCMWADHGDAISLQYSGSHALKGDLTRTGKRTVGGLLQDGVSSIKRCVQNNFADVHRQQVIERFHGYAPTIDEPPVLISPARSPAASASAPSPSAQGDAAEFPDTDAPAER